LKLGAQKDQLVTTPVDRKRIDSNQYVPIDRLTILLRAFVERQLKKPSKKQDGLPPLEDLQPSDWKLIFDTETKTDQSQRLRFGAYQLRSRADLREQGVFYNPETTTDQEVAVIRSSVEAMRTRAVDERIYMMTRDEFVDNVLLGKAYPLGALIIGFNLPFDLSRLAKKHGSAHGKKMKGGFSLTMSDRKDHPHVRIKHQSAHSAFFDFPRTEAEVRNRPEGDDGNDDRRRLTEEGYFLDLRTLSKVLLSEAHSLASLSSPEGLKVETPKIERDDHGETITENYVRYCVGDTQTTWECFEALSARYYSYGLKEVALHELFSEASLGKAYLQAMNVRPWREVEVKLPSKLVGKIMSAYFGGRSEVHLRREIAQVLYCDFLSMYPTVCHIERYDRQRPYAGCEKSSRNYPARRSPRPLCLETTACACASPTR
jgi:DNA polymerase type B, organellar and viral